MANVLLRFANEASTCPAACAGDAKSLLVIAPVDAEKAAELPRACLTRDQHRLWPPARGVG
jgi:hypothetical protein